MRLWILILLFSFSFCSAQQESGKKRQIRVFVALCDNATQGIVKVNPTIGDGDQPASNLYWGCSDGLSAYFKKSWIWKLTKTETYTDQKVIERLVFQHQVYKDVELVAEAYRGSEMKACLVDFLATAACDDEQVELVAFIGHNGLMEHTVKDPPKSTVKRDAIVLGCLTDSYFSKRLNALDCEPILMTRTLMYPGSFLLHDAIEGWLRSETKQQIHQRAARAYAANQKITVKAAGTIFADLK